MKKSCLLLLLGLFIFSCKNAETTSASETTASVEMPKEKPIPQKVTITGHIKNPTAEVATLRGIGIADQVATLTEGKFAMEFELSVPTELTFGHGQEVGSLYLEPDDAVTLSLNTDEFDESIQLAGKGAEESNFLFKKYMLNENMGEMKDIFSLEPAEFSVKVDEMKNTIAAALTTYVKENQGMNPDFIEAQKKGNVYTWATNKMNYPNYYNYFTKKDAPDMGADYLSFISDIDLNDEKAFEKNRNYNSLVRSFIEFEAANVKESPERLDLVFNKVNAKIKNQKIKNALLYRNLNNEIQYGSTEGLEVFIEKYNNATTDEENKTKIAKAYAQAIHLAKGADAPTFAYGNTKDQIVDLKDLKGKNVYIDVWATWCGPCKAEIPSLKKLEHQYKDNSNIAFMSVSIDKVKDKDKWLKMIGDKILGGTQLLADKDWDSSICKDYLIKGIPRFILVDKDGKIINKNAPRPSSNEIKTILADLAKPTQTSMK